MRSLRGLKEVLVLRGYTCEEVLAGTEVLRHKGSQGDTGTQQPRGINLKPFNILIVLKLIRKARSKHDDRAHAPAPARGINLKPPPAHSIAHDAFCEC
jgi:hypothetical protein